MTRLLPRLCNHPITAALKAQVIACLVLARFIANASVHRDTGREISSQLAGYELTGARYELTGVRSDRPLRGLLCRQLRQLLRDQVMVLSELLEQVMAG
jgi:hypothetical protein